MGSATRPGAQAEAARDPCVRRQARWITSRDGAADGNSLLKHLSHGLQWLAGGLREGAVDDAIADTHPRRALRRCIDMTCTPCGAAPASADTTRIQLADANWRSDVVVPAGSPTPARARVGKDTSTPAPFQPRCSSTHGDEGQERVQSSFRNNTPAHGDQAQYDPAISFA